MAVYLVEKLVNLFTTKRLVIRTALVTDASIYFALWTDPRVMANVGFPQGLPITLEAIEEKLRQQKGLPEYGRNLIATLRSSGSAIGECKMMLPNDDGVSKTDIKLLPEFWGQRYGLEIKRGLLAYLFHNTDCLAVEGTPNVANFASIKMQEAVGGVRVAEEVYHFPESMCEYTEPVHHYVYLVYREDWESVSGPGGDPAV